MQKNSFLNKALILLTGAAAGQLLIIITMPLITRIYTPEAFGTFSVFSSIVTILAVLSAFRYEISIPLINDSMKRSNIILLSFIIITTISFLAFIIIILLILLNIIVLNYFYLAIPIAVFFIGLYQLLVNISISNHKIKEVSFTKFSQSFSQVAVQLTGYFFSGSAAILLLGFLVGRFTGIYKLLVANSIINRIFINYDKRIMIESAKEYKKFPYYSLPSSIINSLGVNIVPILILSMFGPAMAGMYSLGNRMVAAPMQLISKSFNSALYSEAPLLKKGELKILFWKNVRNLFIVGSLPVLIVWILEPIFFTQIFGKEWAMAGDILKILVFMLWFQFSIIPLSEVLTIIDKQEIRLKWDIFRLIAVLSVFGYSGINDLDILTTITSYCVTMIICYVILLIICKKALNNKI